MLKYHIITFGCQMNKSDSERIRTVLDNINMRETSNKEEADFILLNTCSVRQSAEDRAFGFMHEFEKLRQEKTPNLILGITGCMPGRDKEKKFLRKLKMVDLYFPIDQIENLPVWLNQLNPNIQKEKKEETTKSLEYLKIEAKYSNSYQMFLPIQTGCDRFCTYCVVPYARGKERNRSLKEILDEAKKFVRNGGLEITLLGQTVNSYEIPENDPDLSNDNPYKTGFAQLLFELNKLEGLKRIFFTAPHPDDMNDETIDALALDKLLNYLHLPVQSGSNKILGLMKRSYTREYFLNIIKKIRNKVPDITIGTDIIVGFSNETTEDFEETISLYKEIEFDISYTAKYSVRSGTFAAKKLEDNVPHEEKEKRWHILQKLMEKITLEKNQKYLNKTVNVLFEKHKNGIAEGWSDEMKKTVVKSTKNIVGQYLPVNITESKTWILEGELT